MKYFKLSEFDSPDLSGSGGRMNEAFLCLLDDIREDAGFPFRINSGFRTPEHNELVGGKPSSAHLKGLAADINATTGEQKFKIVQEAIYKGVKRIGIGKTFIHLDIDESLPNPSIWLY
jgi:uncharacterized protein YcbK (DUF882 family)